MQSLLVAFETMAAEYRRDSRKPPVEPAELATAASGASERKHSPRQTCALDLLFVARLGAT